MNLLVTGGTGFVGQHLVEALLAHGHRLTLLGRDKHRLDTFNWRDRVKFITWDIHSDSSPDLQELGNPDVLVHLAWQGLPNYKDTFHLDENLPANVRFIESLVKQGLCQLLVTGTCLEYGLQEGELNESMETSPTIAYAEAKDHLRKRLQQLQKIVPYRLLWCRLFYLYGRGQNPNSLLAQLNRAIDRNDEVFNMSGGEQKRDYLAIEEAVSKMVGLLESPNCEGIYNICSGQPITIKSIVEHHIQNRSPGIRLNLGHYPYPDYEPMAFWGATAKLDSCLLVDRDV